RRLWRGKAHQGSKRHELQETADGKEEERQEEGSQGPQKGPPLTVEPQPSLILTSRPCPCVLPGVNNSSHRPGRGRPSSAPRSFPGAPPSTIPHARPGPPPRQLPGHPPGR